MLKLSSTASKLLHETSSFIWKLLGIALVLCLGGIYYAHLENEQVKIQREITSIQRDISICQMQTEQLKAKAENLSNRWALLDRLNQNNSELGTIQANQIETLRAPQSGLAHNER